MKKLLVALLLAAPIMGLAQQKETKMQAYTLHEDQVKPSMVSEYETYSKELVALMKQHNISDFGWLCSVTDDFRYWFTRPINSMSDLDKNPFAALTEKAGKDKMKALWDKMDKCYDRHGTSIVRLDHELSYQPGGIDQAPEGMPFREFHFWHVAPSNLEAFSKAASDIKALCISKKSPLHYRVYRSGFGSADNYFLVAFAAKDAASFHAKQSEARTMLGEELTKLHSALMALTLKYEEIQGSIRSDLSYNAQTKPMAEAK